jgi:hypothetical protein
MVPLKVAVPSMWAPRPGAIWWNTPLPLSPLAPSTTTVAFVIVLAGVHVHGPAVPVNVSSQLPLLSERDTPLL